MNIRKFFSLIFSIVLIGLVFIFCFDVEASSSIINLHTLTKVYSSNNTDYYDGCEDYDDYRNSSPTITVLTHGLGGRYQNWSNNYGVNGNGDFAYNSNSIIAKLYNHLNGELTIYVAKASSNVTIDSTTNTITNCEYNGYDLYKISYSDYVNNPTNLVEVDYLDDVSKHIILLFDSNNSGLTHEFVYEQFHDVLDNMSYQYKVLTGVLPRYNLIGHSRGGVINLMYAIDHMYNVDSIFSMGTPYNGSTLGLIDPVMEMLGYYLYDSKGNTYTDPDSAGVDDIMNEQVSIDLRDAWNAAYTADVDINVVAYGSMTSIDFIRALVNEIASNSKYSSESYYTVIQDYLDTLNSIINVVDNYPNLISNTLTFVNDFAHVIDAFGIDLYDYVFTSIDSSLEGDITAEEVDQILSLFNVINDNAVIMDDLFIDTNSQLGYGFSDGISYNGFKRYVKIFDDSDLSTNCAYPSMPAIPHNLEIMCPSYIDTIVSSIDHGIPSSNIYNLEDNVSGTYYFSNANAFAFYSDYNGNRVICASGCSIDVFYYDNGYLKSLKSGTTSLTIDFEANVNYLIVITKTSSGNLTVSFTPEDSLSIGTNSSISFDSLEGRVFKINVTTAGYYLIDISNTYIYCEDVVQYDTGKYYIYFTSGNNIVYLKNNSSYSTQGSVVISTPKEITQGESFNLTADNRILMFTNTFGNTLNFEVNLSWSSTSNSLNVYNQSLGYVNNCATGTVSSSSATYTFKLQNGESCYIIFDKTDSAGSASITLPEEQLAWKINDVICSSNIISLPRGYTYTVSLWSLVNGTYYEIDCDLGFPVAANSTYSYSGNTFTIYSGTGTDHFAVTCSIAFGFSLSVTVEDDFVITMSSVNYASSATLTYSINKSSCTIKGYANNSSGTTYLTWTASSSSKTVNVTSYVFPSSTALNTTFRFYDVIYNGITYRINTWGVHTVDIKFGSGSGTSSDPYTINCVRHLNNVRSYSSKYYKQTSNIDLSSYGVWTPIPSFSGTYDGNSNYIYYLTLEVTANDADYGLFAYVSGTVKNVYIKYITVTTILTSSTSVSRSHVGSVCAFVQTSGTITNCHLYSGTFDADVIQLTAGGISGVNFGSVTNCTVNSVTMNVSGRAGGIIGENSGKVYTCKSKSITITHYWVANTFTGGVVGFNTDTGEVKSCTSGGMIYWTSPEKGDHIYPSIGHIIGYNAGSYSDCSSTMGHDISYYYWHFIGWYDQSQYCFAEDDGLVGQQV